MDAGPQEPDPDIGAVAAQMTAQRKAMAAWLVDGLRHRAALRSGLGRAEAIDTVWLFMDPAVFTRLTGTRGWPRPGSKPGSPLLCSGCWTPPSSRDPPR